ncbi:hypothetical protein NST66_27560 [Priestia sp. FSL W8-0524]|uniref:hypothetical protein n=1 Tax=Priestia sp. FSL W8-0524 TaxID=2954625 RepID=UPI0015F51ABB
MSKVIKTAFTAVLTTGLITACSAADTGETSSSKVEKVKMADMQKVTKEENEKIIEQQENEDWQNLREGVLTYRQHSKGGYYNATVESAIYKENKQGSPSITAKVQIENVREDGKNDDLSEIKYYIKNKKTGEKFTGVAMPLNHEAFKELAPNSTVTYDVLFEISDKKELNSYYLYMVSKLDPFSDIHWKLENLTESNHAQ